MVLIEVEQDRQNIPKVFNLHEFTEIAFPKSLVLHDYTVNFNMTHSSDTVNPTKLSPNIHALSIRTQHQLKFVPNHSTQPIFLPQNVSKSSL